MKPARILAVALLLGSVPVVVGTPPAQSATGDVTTVAGPAGVGDGGPATSGHFLRPMGVAADSSGNLYVADTGHHRVRMFSPGGTITTVAGTGYPGSSGDGGPATAARLDSPTAVAVDGSGNLYIADTGNHKIRIVIAGTITTIAGTGSAGPSGDGLALNRSLYYPSGIAVNSSGDVFIADKGNHIVRKLAGGTLTKIAGTVGTSGSSGDSGLAVSATLNSPSGVAIDSGGNIIIADTSNHTVRKVTGTTISTIAGTAGTSGSSGDGGPAAGATLNTPIAVTVDSSDNIYVISMNSHRVRKFTAGGNISTFAGTSSGFSGDNSLAVGAQMNDPSGLTSHAGDVYIVDRGNNRVRRVAGGTGIITTVAGSGTWGTGGDGGPATAAVLRQPRGVATDSAGNIYIADTWNHRIRKVTVSTGQISTVAGNGVSAYTGDGGLATTAKLNLPMDVAVDSIGNIYIADTANWAIRKVSASTGIITTVIGNNGNNPNGYGDGFLGTNASLVSPEGVAVDTSGNIYVADRGDDRIRKLSAATGLMSTVAGGGAGGDGGAANLASLNDPMDVVVDSLGNIYIAEHQANKIRKVDVSTSIISTYAGTGSIGGTGNGGPAVSATLYWPRSLALDHDGNLFVVEDGNYSVRKIAKASGDITLVAGNVTALMGYFGDGGPATSALIMTPKGIAVDPFGNVYTVSWDDHRVRKIEGIAAPVPTTTIPSTTPPATTIAPLVVPRTGGLTPKQLATYLTMSTPARSKISISVPKSSSKTCYVKKAKLLSRKTGTCKFTVTVKPKKGKTVRRTTSLASA